MPYTRRMVLFEGTSDNSTTFTSSDFLVADYDNLVISVQTSDNAASRMTLEGTLESGITASIITRSVLTTITVPGIYSIDPGVRYMRAVRSSLDSLGEVTLQGKSR